MKRLQKAWRRGAVPEQDSSCQPAFAYDDLFVNAAARIRIGDDFVFVVGRFLLAEHDEIDAHDLQLRRNARTRIDRFGSRAAEAIGEDLSLLPARCDQPIGLSTMLRAFTNRMN